MQKQGGGEKKLSEIIINKAKAKAKAKFSALQHAEVQKHKAKMFNNEMLILSFKQY